MAAAFAPELAYAFRRQELVIVGDVAASQASALLGQIEQGLVSAAGDFAARQYQDAIGDYTAVRKLIWSQLFPSTEYDEALSQTSNLLRPLVSYGAEWLNVLPIEQAANGVRPREDAPTGVGKLLGLRSQLFNDVGVRAAADLELSSTLSAMGNAGAAKFFHDRAVATAPALVTAIGAQVQPAAQAPLAGALVERPDAEIAALAPRIPIGPIINRPPIGLGLPGPRIPIEPPPIIRVPPTVTVAQRTYTVIVGGALTTISWADGSAPAVDDILAKIYAPRVAQPSLPDMLMAPKHPADVAISLAHVWLYETTLGLAECYHALGDYAPAESWYELAAAYPYLNAASEVPYLWTRLAQLYLEWGDSLFRTDQPELARPVYENVITTSSQAPTTGTLYTAAPLKPTADVARTIITKLGDQPTLNASPNVAHLILDVHAQLAKIAGGLDFWGQWANNVPIWTFDYLQSVATNFCQLAMSAERDSMGFWEKADSGNLTRQQLTQNVSQAGADATAANMQAGAAQSEVAAYAAAKAGAQLRAQDARANVTEYTNLSWEWTLHQAQSAQLSGGDDGDANQLNNLASQMTSGSYSIDGSRATLSAAEQLASSRLQRDYEIDSMQRQAAELDAATTQATAELAAANARSAAAQAQAAAAGLRVMNAQQLLAVFDAQRFTPDVWNRLGQRMSALSARYLGMALDVAKRMQRAYNFEQDVGRLIIKSDYASDAVAGFLAADSLMADIQSFAYDLVTLSAPKSQPVKQTISLAGSYPFAFESALRKTGKMDFETRIEDFDVAYPGTFAGRIEHIEVAIDGIVPARGISGTLTCAGISHYRVPAAAWAAGTSGLKHRVQNSETAVLSDYDVRSDALVTDTDNRKLRVFEGAGVASAWTLELPPAINELNYGAITDVRLTFSYQARYDPALKTKVLADLATRPALDQRSRAIPLLWLFPDAFFAFYQSGVMSFSLDQSFFPLTEQKPVLQGVSLLVVASPAAKQQGIMLNVSAPGKAAVAVTTQADGTVPASALTAASGGSALGAWKLELKAADNPSWVSGGALALDAIVNVSLLISYQFTPRT